MIEQLFGSKTRVKLLKLFFSNPNRPFYVREITRKVEEQINSVRRELANLLSIGLITSESANNKLYYEVNQKFTHYAALGSMFAQNGAKPFVQKELKSVSKASKAKSSGKKQQKDAVKPDEHEDRSAVELPEAKHWQNAGNIAGIAYSGVFTRDESAGVDILVIGDALVSKVESVIAGLEKEKNKELRYAIITPAEWAYRAQVHDKFWLQFMSAKVQVVLDKQQIFENK